jgi:hypothetical protein
MHARNHGESTAICTILKGGISMGTPNVNRRMWNYMRGCVVFLALSALFSVGCTHSMHIFNLEDFSSPPSTALKEPVRLGVSSKNDMHPLNRRYVAAIVEALQKDSRMGSVVYPYNQSVRKDAVDVVVDIMVSPRYSGQGSNFFVNFPGFLIFAPAVWGYGYSADLETVAVVTNLKNGTSQQVTIPCHYRFRHAAINRTWTEVGWFEVGLIPLIGGIVFTNYDDDATGEFITKVSPSYGPYVAEKIVSVIDPMRQVSEALKSPSHKPLDSWEW